MWSDFKIASIIHLLEFGTAERFQKSGKSVGSIKASPSFARGRNKSRAAVAAILTSGYKLIIERTATAK